MLIFKSKFSVFNILINILATGLLAWFVYLAISNPLAYIGVGVFGLALLFANHKSNFLILKRDGIIYRKYFIWKKIKFNKIASVYIVKHSFVTRTGVAVDFHNKQDKKVQGCIFFAKSEPSISKNSLENSVKMANDWSNFYFDVQFQEQILTSMIVGGFTGEIYITEYMYNILSEDLQNLLSKNEYNFSNIKILATTRN